MAVDRHYFARPERTLFCDIRSLLPDERAGPRPPGRRPLYRLLAQQFLIENPLAGYASISGEAAAVPRDHAQRRRLPARAAAAQRLLPLPSTPGRHRGPGARGSLSVGRILAGELRSRRYLRGASYPATSVLRPKPTPGADMPACPPPTHLSRRRSVGFLGLGIMGSRMAARVAQAGFALTVWTHTPGKAAAWASEHERGRRGRHARRGRAQERDRREHGRRRRAGRVGAAGRERRDRGRARGSAVRRHVHDLALRQPPDRRGAGRARGADARRSRHGLLPARGGGHAHDHGRRRPPRTSPAPSRCCRAWAR